MTASRLSVVVHDHAMPPADPRSSNVTLPTGPGIDRVPPPTMGQSHDQHMMRTERSPPRPPRRLSPARLAGRDRRARRLAASDRARRVRADARSSSPIRRRRARPARARRRRPDAGLAASSTARRCAPDGYVATPDGLTIAQPPHRPFTLEIETAGRSDRQHPAVGALPLERHLLHAVRGRRLPPHHLFPRPARRDGGLHDAHRGRQGRGAGAARQRQSASRAATCPAAGISRSGTIRSRSPSYLFALVGGDLGCVEDRFVTMSGRNVALRIYVEPGKEDRCGYAMDALKRSMRWDEEAFGREYDLDIFMIVAVSDFNMGAMENKGLNVFNDKYVLASPDDRDRRRLRQHRGDHRARILPQLDRQPHHLPRLVPALPEGRPHRLPRPGVHLRPALARRSSASATCACCAPHQFVEDAGPLAHPVRPELYREINNFYTADRLREGRRGRAHAEDAARARRVPQGHGPLFRAPRRRGRDGRAVHPLLRRRERPRPDAVHALVFAGRHAGGRGDRPTTTPHANTYRLDLAQTLPPTPGQPAKEPMVIPLAIGLVGARRPRPAADAGRRPRRRARRARARPAARRPSPSPTSPSRRCSRSTAASRRRSSSSPT